MIRDPALKIIMSNIIHKDNGILRKEQHEYGFILPNDLKSKDIDLAWSKDIYDEKLILSENYDDR
jgi:hypothetical protein